MPVWTSDGCAFECTSCNKYSPMDSQLIDDGMVLHCKNCGAVVTFNLSSEKPETTEESS